MTDNSHPNQIFTDVQQSKRLVVSGVNTDTADMSYINGSLSRMPYSQAMTMVAGVMCGEVHLQRSTEIEPAWSLPMLLRLLPRGNTSVFHLCMETGEDENTYRVWDSCLLSPGFDSPSAIEAVVKALAWSNFNKYKIKGFH